MVAHTNRHYPHTIVGLAVALIALGTIILGAYW